MPAKQSHGSGAMGPGPPTGNLGRREREILEIVYRLTEASVTEVRAEMQSPPSYSAVRTMLNYLESKGYLRHRREGVRYIYLPTLSKAKARVSALRHVMDTFFDGSIAAVVSALVDSRKRLTPTEVAHLRRVIDGGARERDR